MDFDRATLCKVLAILFLLVSLSPPISAKTQKPLPPAPTVVVTPAKLKKVNPTKKYVGHVEAIQEVEIQPRVEGYLERVAFKEGQYVTKGQLLYVIDPAPYKATVLLREAQLMEARAALHKAQMHLRRLRAAKPESVPATTMDNAIAEEEMARARVKEAQAQLDLARIDLGYTLILAPISGLIGKTFFTQGNLVGPNQGPLARLVQLEPIRVVYSIGDKDLLELQKALKGHEPSTEAPGNLEVRLRLPDGSLYPEKGRIEFIDNHVDPTTGTIAIRAIFPNKNHLLLPGEYVDVLVSPRGGKKTLVIPQEAVLMDSKGYHVLVVDKKNRVEERRVQLGPQIGREWVVKSGLSPGELVIVQGIQKVRPGQKVKIILEKTQGT